MSRNAARREAEAVGDDGFMRFGPTAVKVEHKDDEWCHVCGARDSDRFVEFWIPENAEHSRRRGAKGSVRRPRAYVRICRQCVADVHDDLTGRGHMETCPAFGLPPDRPF